VLDTPFNVTLAPVYSLSFAGTDLVLLHPDHASADMMIRKNKACLIGALIFACQGLPLFCLRFRNISLRRL
jgi:hypothetical protein